MWRMEGRSDRVSSHSCIWPPPLPLIRITCIGRRGMKICRDWSPFRLAVLESDSCSDSPRSGPPAQDWLLSTVERIVNRSRLSSRSSYVVYTLSVETSRGNSLSEPTAWPIAIRLGAMIKVNSDLDDVSWAVPCLVFCKRVDSTWRS